MSLQEEASVYQELIKTDGISKGNTVAVVAIHLIALIATPFLFTWSGLIVAILLYYVTGLGITVGFHRLLTHNGFKTFKWVRFTAALIGAQALEGSAIKWVCNHRKHHKHSDKPGDPHSPRHGKWWSHMLWIATPEEKERQQKDFEQYVPDLLAETGLMWLHRTFLAQITIAMLTIFISGYMYGGLVCAFSWLVIAGPVRIVWVWHITWAINSMCHLWGYRLYETRDDSKNNWLAALLAHGEGWHNNHHAEPKAVAHGHKWWEVDLSYQIIKLMKLTGFAWELQLPKCMKKH